MKLIWALVPLLLATLAVHSNASALLSRSGESSEEVEGLPLAEACDPETCQLPSCRCSGVDIPGGLTPRETPQFVLVTFDDGVNILNIETYRDLLNGRTNSNNCPVGATFYVSHEYTNYVAVNELYNSGYEIGLHSISHQTPQTYWAEASRETIAREFADQRVQMAHFANIPLNAIQGMRLPFLQLAGNASFEVMQDIELLYDSSWTTINFINPGMWPYTLDYASTQDCQVPPCPSASIPGPWVIPMISWQDHAGYPCSMADACFSPPDVTDEEAWLEFIVENFERHYFSNRAPFGFYVHEWYLRANPAVYRALLRFLDIVNNLPDAFMVNTREVIDWVRDPVPVEEYRSRPCRWQLPTQCSPMSCGNLEAPHTSELFWMQICNVCPRVYPWLGNPLGQ